MTDAARAGGPVASRSPAEVVERVVENLQRAVRAHRASARKELRRLLRPARGELSLSARFRGLVSLRSLRSAGTQ